MISPFQISTLIEALKSKKLHYRDSQGNGNLVRVVGYKPEWGEFGGAAGEPAVLLSNGVHVALSNAQPADFKLVSITDVFASGS